MKTKKKRKGLPLQQKKGLSGYIYVAPFIIGLLLLYLSSIVQSFIFSINKINISNTGYSLTSEGLNYYKYIFTVDPNFIRTEVETISTLLGNLAIVIIYSLFISVLLNQKMRGRGVIRAIFFLPVILATGIIAQIEAQNLQYEIATSGLNAYLQEAGLNSSYHIVDIVRALNLGETFSTFIISAAEGIYSIIKGSGVQIIIFLAGLQSISPAIYEAARVEGCSGWEAFWKITLPLISPLVPVCVVWTISESFLNIENKVMTLITDMAYKSSDYSMASAMAWINFVAMGVVVGLVLLVLNKFVFYENKVTKIRLRR